MNYNNNLLILHELIDNGTIDEAIGMQLVEKMTKERKKEILNSHPWAISQGKDGKWRTYLPDPIKGRIQVKRSTKESVEQKLFEFYDNTSIEPTLEQVFTLAKNQKLEKRIQLSTINEYDKAFNKLLEPYKTLKISKIHKRTVKLWFDDYKEKNGQISFSQFNKFRDLISCIFTYLEVEGYIDFSYPEAIRLVNLNKALYTLPVVQKSEDELWFNESEQALLINYCRTHADVKNMALLLLLDTGMRPGEICALNKDCIDLRGYITVRRRLTRCIEDGKTIYNVVERAKTDKGNRVAIVSDSCLDILHILYNGADTNGFILHGVQVKNLTDRLTTICKTLNIAKRSVNKLRKTASTNMRLAGMSDHDITEQNGHISITTTEKSYIQKTVEAPLRRLRYLDNQGNQGNQIKKAVNP